jgi:alkanesulfonate monooxygenase SsuD/methylene tetrahydromethanopterin reductase-like flavin-dependent oxidoreductase (luciferase family)
LETVPEKEVAGVQAFMAGFDISKPIEQRVDPELVTDYLVNRFSIAGTPEECIARVKSLQAVGVKRLLLTPPNVIYNEVMQAWGEHVLPFCA